jgi:hypothetical protein
MASSAVNSAGDRAPRQLNSMRGGMSEISQGPVANREEYRAHMDTALDCLAEYLATVQAAQYATTDMPSSTPPEPRP